MPFLFPPFADENNSDPTTILQFSNKPLTVQAFPPYHRTSCWRSYYDFCCSSQTCFRSQAANQFPAITTGPLLVATTIYSHTNLPQRFHRSSRRVYVVGHVVSMGFCHAQGSTSLYPAWLLCSLFGKVITASSATLAAYLMMLSGRPLGFSLATVNCCRSLPKDVTQKV